MSLESSKIILADQAAMSPALTLGLALMSFIGATSIVLLPHFETSANTAQYLAMFPPELGNAPYFFVEPHWVMTQFIRCLYRTEYAVNMWLLPESIDGINATEARRLREAIYTARDRLNDIRLQCEYIIDFQEIHLNGDLERIVRELRYLRTITENMGEIINNLTTAFNLV